MNTCKQCQKQFEITDSDRAFYKKMDVSEPVACPLCRARRRLAFRNERTFYKDTCGKCKKPIVSQFSPDLGYLVYCESCYFKDDWAGQDYGRDFDFSKAFGEQFDVLNRAVPHMAMIHTFSQNCEYTHLAANNKDCYMLIESSDNEQCIHSYWVQKCLDCVDTSYLHESQLVYDSDDLVNCYRLSYSSSCTQCTDSYFLSNCRNCTNCFGCVNLSNKQYCVFNEQKTKEEYEQFIKDQKLSTWSGVQVARKKVETFALAQPRKHAYVVNAENSTGNYLRNVKNVQYAFHVYDAEDCKYVEHVWRDSKDCMDVSTVGIGAALVYESLNNALGVYMMRFCNQCWHSGSGCDYCFYSSLENGFGCIAIKKGKYCIFNKEYSKSEYAQLKAKIIEHMKKTGEWGQFLDPKYSPFGYNETVAREMYPLKKEEALQLGFRWNDKIAGSFGKETIKADALSDSINDVQDSVVGQIFACGSCKKNYTVIAQELAFYRRQQIPIPRQCPDCRHYERVKSRGPNTLWHRQCMCAMSGHGWHTVGKCKNEFETTYAPERPETVYCEPCYQAEMV